MNFKKINIFIFSLVFLASLLINLDEKKNSGIYSNNPSYYRSTNRIKAGKPKADKPGEAVKWMFEQRAYPTKGIPTDWRNRALTHINNNNLLKDSKTAINWTAVGPYNIGGRVRAIAISNQNPDLIYASSVSGGIFKSTNGGSSWVPISDYASNLAISSIVIDPNNNNIIYAGTGEGFFNYDAVRGEGILKTNDGGITWSLQKNFSGTTEFPYFINDLYLRPDSTNILYAATNNGLFRTTNSGNNWSFIHQGSFSIRATQVVGDPLTPATFYICYGNHTQDGIYKTINGGKTFTKLSSGFPTAGYNRIALAVSKSNPNILFASLDSASTHFTHSIQKSTDGGITWTAVAKPIDLMLGGSHLGGQGWYNNVIAVHPTNQNLVFAGGVNLFKSTNGGASWSMSTYGYPPSAYPYVHVDHHEIKFHPTDPAIIYFGTDGGIFKTTNTGTTFIELNNGFETTQFYSGAVHPTSDIYYGGTQDNGTLKSNTLPNWSMVFGGDGGATAVDFNSPNIVYTEYINLHIRKSTNSGTTWLRAMAGIPAGTGEYDGTTDRVLFIAPFVMDPTNSSILVAGTYKLYRTTNSAVSWISMSNDLTGDGTGAIGSKISAIAISKTSSSTIYVGTTGSSTSASRVVVTTNTGVSWATISKPPLPNRYVTSLAIHENNSDVVWVGFSGYNTNTTTTPGHIFKSTNRGSSWTDVSGNLPDIPINTIIVNPMYEKNILIGTDLGIFETNDGGTVWTQQNYGMANVVVADLDLRSDYFVFAATHGRGMFKARITVFAPNDTIYPGDTNNDGIVDARDILPIAQYYGNTGYPRINPSLNWSPQQLSGPFSPIQAAYADCNGNGTVQATDVQAIIQNWFFTRNPISMQPTNRVTTCEELLNSIGKHPTSSPMKEIRSEIIRYRSELLNVPNEWKLDQNYPNPFNSSTKIRFNTPEEVTSVKLIIYDITGKLIKEMGKTNVLPGYNYFEWDSTNDSGLPVSSGVFYYTLTSDKIRLSKKMILIR